MSEHLFEEDDLKGFLKEKKFDHTTIPIKINRKEHKKTAPKKIYHHHQSIGQSFLGIFFIFLKGVGIFVFIFIVSFLIINAPAIYSNFNYYWQKSEKRPINYQTITPTQADIYSNNSLIIPKISVNAPIIWQVPENEVLDKLRNGVVSYTGTAMPGEQGNVFIVGHSSYYLWAPGNYKSVFAVLDNLKNDDKIYLKYQDKIFTYQVTAKETVNPDNLEVIGSGSGKQLKLMTCVPIGTNLQRLIVTAKQI